MGGRSSKFVKRYEYHTNYNQLLHMLEELKTAKKEENDELNKNMRKLQTEINMLQSFQQRHTKHLNNSEQQQNVKHTNLSNQIEGLRKSLNEISLEHKEDRVQFPSTINKEIANQRRKWTDDVVELRNRMEGLKKHSMEMITMDLAHEREIKDLQKRIRYLEDKLMLSSDANFSKPKRDDSAVNLSTHSNLDMSQRSSPSSAPVGPESCGQCGRQTERKSIPGSKSPFSTSSSYDSKFSKINMAMKKLKEDIKYAEVKRLNSFTS